MPARTVSNVGKTRGAGMDQPRKPGQASRNEDLPAGGTNPQDAAPPLQGRLQKNHARLTMSELVAEIPIDVTKLNSTPPTSSDQLSTDNFATASHDALDGTHPKSMLTSRRRQSSIPNAKVPQGPRPLDGSMGKR